VAAVVVAGYRQGQRVLSDQLNSKAPDLEVCIVGDALSPRFLHDAVTEGMRAGNAV
jgi:hypothetical protein